MMRECQHFGFDFAGADFQRQRKGDDFGGP